MADDNSPASQAVWPVPAFAFRVTIAGEEVTFQEVSGLDIETEVIEYRAGNSKVFSTIKMPGMVSSGHVTLKHGVFARQGAFWDWFSGIKMNTMKRTDVAIALVDTTGAPTMQWTLKNAFPTKITGTDLKAEGNEIAVETVELAYEGITIDNA
ncbi:phage tail protein [Tateyamaria sp. ANG-S1]|uniref:phage tail protein n=1 Tax=Tateyamaria sp. ANG-S1 TaxID=1577905 RepID=UPI00057F064C|nr:phage tail protein [Tateyamaria sp. ANG-S1]KIC50330.1 phage tail protein [Tateyamaria sp. ANG-S1]